MCDQAASRDEAELKRLQRRVAELEAELAERRQVEAHDVPRTVEQLWEMFRDEDRLCCRLLNSIRDAVYVFDPEGRYVFVNRAGRANEGRSLDELRRRHYWDAVPPESRDTVVERFNAAVSGDLTLSDPQPDQVEYEAADGSHTVAEVTSQPIRSGDRIVGLIGTARDISDRQRAEKELTEYRERLEQLVAARTSELEQANSCLREEVSERARAEEALRASEEEYRTLVNNLTVGIYRGMLDGRVVRANPALAELLGYDRSEDMGEVSALSTYAHPENRPALIAHLLEHGFVKDRQVELQRRDGSTLWASVTARLQRGPDGEPQWIDGLIEDITERKEAERRIHQLTQFLQGVIDNASIMITAVDADGNLMLWNTAAEELTGYTREEVIGNPQVHEWLYPDPEYRVWVQARTRRAMDRGEPVDGIEAVIRCKDGNRRRTKWHARPMRDMSGRPGGLVALGWDVTEKREADRSIHELTQFLQGVIDNANVWMDVLDRDGNVVIWNKAAEQISGYAKEEVVGNNRIWEWLYPDRAYRAGIMARATEIIEQGKAIEGHETIIRRKDGQRRRISWNSRQLLDPKGQPAGSIAMGRDVTERRQAEDQLRQSRERLEHIINNTSDIIFQIDTNGNYIFGNAAAEAVTGYPLDELMGMNMSRLLAPEYRKPVFERLARRLRGEPLEQPYHFDFIRKDGRRATLELTTAGIWQGDDLVGVQGMARDVTERERADRALRESQEHLKVAHAKLVTARDEERRHLASELHDSVGQSIVALELAIQGVGRTVQSHSREELAGRCAGLAEQCGQIIREVRAICHGLYPPTLESLGLPAALGQLRRFCEDAGVDAEVECLDGTDTDRLEPEIEIALFRIAQEAVNNAIRHSEASAVAIRLRKEPGAAVLTVEDDGKGFEPEAVAGRGFGMNSMYERAAAVAGELEVSSRPGRTQVLARAPLTG